ncbi:MAG: PAS domain-containing sensor histidine kinase [Bacteroidota bacterium]|nr:PAS domain-containing sensor histidine kinase [Bacteroidota bacterium]
MNAYFDNDSSLDYFESLYNNAKQNCVLIMDTEGDVIAINAAFTKCFGYAEKDIVGKNAAILFTEEDLKAGMFKKELSNVLHYRQAFDNNYLVNKNKTVIWASGESMLVRHSDGRETILKVIQNIHERKLSEIALRHLNDFNESILGSIEDAVIVIDKEMNILKANNAFINLFKSDVPDILSFNFSDLIKPYDSNSDMHELVENVFINSKAFSNKQIELNTAKGEERMFEVSCTPLQTSGDRNVLIIIHDVTVYKQLEKEREDIMGFVAHELRNPLSNVMLCNELMGDAFKENKPEQVNELLQRSKNNVMRLNKMIAELYEATRVSSGNLRLEISTFNFEEMVKEAISTFEVLQPAYNIIVTGNGSVQISGDRYRLIQVITNYLSNGIKYSDGKKDVKLRIKHNENTVIVSVKDEGVGISKDQLPYIFERFFRVEKTRNIEGIGLGLYLCRQIIHAHKGHVWVESDEGKGSTFYFSIPVDLTSVE